MRDCRAAGRRLGFRPMPNQRPITAEDIEVAQEDFLALAVSELRRRGMTNDEIDEALGREPSDGDRAA
jgi:hypothetical protein